MENAGKQARKLPKGLAAVAIVSMTLCPVILGFSFIGYALSGLGGHQGRPPDPPQWWFPFAYGAGLGVAGGGLFSRFRDWARLIYVALAAWTVFKLVASIDDSYAYQCVTTTNTAYRAANCQDIWIGVVLWLAVLVPHLWLIWYMLRRAKQPR